MEKYTRSYSEECNEIMCVFGAHLQGFTQHSDETDPERVKQIISRAVEDGKWIVEKVMTVCETITVLIQMFILRQPCQ